LTGGAFSTGFLMGGAGFVGARSAGGAVCIGGSFWAGGASTLGADASGRSAGGAGQQQHEQGQADGNVRRHRVHPEILADARGHGPPGHA
jgi:hypothetical protein